MGQHGHYVFVYQSDRLGYQIATKHRVPLEILGHAMQAYNKTMYTYGDEAPCYSTPRMLEEALGVDLRLELTGQSRENTELDVSDQRDLKTGNIPSRMLTAVQSSDTMALTSREPNRWETLKSWLS